MTPTTKVSKVSTCVDCATKIIGERLRCPACHDLHAANVVAREDDAVTAPLPRQRVRVVNRSRGQLTAGVFKRWIVAIEFLVIVGLALVLLVKGCSR